MPDNMDSRADEPIAAAGRDYLLRPGVVFLNHGSFGACPRPVFETYQRWQRELEGEPVEFLARRLDGLLADARAALAKFVGTEADNLVFVPNATHAMNIIARSLDLRPGDEVLGTTHEYGAVDRTWRFMCEQHGAQYRKAAVSLPVTTAEALVEQVWSGVTERTRVLVISHITSPTALIFPVAELCRRARQHGLLSVVDGAHAPGHVDLDLDAIGATYYTGNCHKWLCAPKGAGFLYVRRDRQELIRPPVISHGANSRRTDPSNVLAVPDAIKFIGSQLPGGWKSVMKRNHDLAVAARQVLCDALNVAP